MVFMGVVGPSFIITGIFNFQFLNGTVFLAQSAFHISVVL